MAEEESGKQNKKKWASTLMGVVFSIHTLLLAAMWLTGSQRAVTGWGELLCAVAWMWMANWRPIKSQAGRRKACSTLQHVAAYCNTLQLAQSVETTAKKKQGKEE